MTPEQPLVTYMWVSTSKQGRSGLGLDAQRAALIHFAQAERFHIVHEFVEVDSGNGHDALDRRPQLRAALAHAKKHRCYVGVAKLDRLSRDVHFISGLRRHGFSGAHPLTGRQVVLSAEIFTDLNPIEQVFAKLKRLLRKAAARTVEAVWDAIGQLLSAFVPKECASYFKNAGYASTKIYPALASHPPAERSNISGFAAPGAKRTVAEPLLPQLLPLL